MAGLNIDRTRNVRLVNPRPGKAQPARIAHEEHPKTRLLLAGCASLLLHLGFAAIFSMEHKEELINPNTAPEVFEPPAPPPALPETPTLSPAERDQELAKLLRVKQLLLRRITVFLNTGNGDLTLPDFLIKSRVLDHNIETLQAGSDNLLHEDDMRDKYKTVLREARPRVELFDDTGEKLDVLHNFSHSTQFRAYLKASGSPLNILIDGTYNCESATLFLAALQADLIGTKKYGLVFIGSPSDPPGICPHMFSWFEDIGGLWQIENTDGGYPRRRPFKAGLRAPVEIVYAAYLLKNGGSVDQLPADLARLYDLGVNADGYPLADAPSMACPSDELQPNPYFLGSKNDLIKKARVIATSMAFLKGQENVDSEAIDLRLINIPEGIDWLKVAQDARTIPPGIISAFDLSSMAERVYGASDIYWLSSQIYVTAMRVADLLKAESGDRPLEDEFQKLLSFIERLKRGDLPPYNERSGELARVLLFPERGRELLLDLYRSAEDEELQSVIFEWICALHSFEDLELFKAEIAGEPAYLSGPGRKKGNAIRALGEMEGDDRPPAIEILRAALSRETIPFFKSDLVESLARLGSGMEAVRFLTRFSEECTVQAWREHLQVVEGRDLSSIAESNQISRVSLAGKIDRLYPDRDAGPDDIRYLAGLIRTEQNPVVKANLIAILALNGGAETAEALAEELIFPFLLDPDFSGLSGRRSGFGGTNPEKVEAGELILALGKIDSARIREGLLRVLEVHPELALEIGDVFVRQNFRSEKIIDELKKILDNTDPVPSHLIDSQTVRENRTYAALLLILMGEI